MQGTLYNTEYFSYRLLLIRELAYSGEKKKKGVFFVIIDISERSKAMNNKESKEWVRLPLKCLKDSDLTLSDAIVLSIILDYIDVESKPMSIEKIMQKTELSKMQVNRSIKALVKAEYLTVERRAGKKTVFTQCEVLPPKRQKQKKSKESNLDLEKYKIFINQFPDTAEKK